MKKLFLFIYRWFIGLFAKPIDAIEPTIVDNKKGKSYFFGMFKPGLKNKIGIGTNSIGERTRKAKRRTSKFNRKINLQSI